MGTGRRQVRDSENRAAIAGAIAIFRELSCVMGMHFLSVAGLFLHGVFLTFASVHPRYEEDNY